MMKTMNPPSKDAAAHARSSSFTRNSRSMPSLISAAATTSQRRTHASHTQAPPHHHAGSVNEQSTISSSVSFSSFQQQKRMRDSFSSQSTQHNQTWSFPPHPADQSPSHPQHVSAQHQLQHATLEYQGSGGKRSRPNNYRAPREVKPSVTSVLGSLAGGSAAQSNTSVQMRRILSGSQLDQFLSGGSSSSTQTGASSATDQMDTDDSGMIASAQQRERAMSF